MATRGERMPRPRMLGHLGWWKMAVVVVVAVLVVLYANNCTQYQRMLGIDSLDVAVEEIHHCWHEWMRC